MKDKVAYIGNKDKRAIQQTRDDLLRKDLMVFTYGMAKDFINAKKTRIHQAVLFEPFDPNQELTEITALEKAYNEVGLIQQAVLERGNPVPVILVNPAYHSSVIYLPEWDFKYPITIVREAFRDTIQNIVVQLIERSKTS